MKLKLTILTCLIAFVTQAQTFQDFIMNGDKFYAEGKYLESAMEYEKAFGLNDGDYNHYYNAACSWSLAGDTIQSIQNLNLSVDKGWRDLKQIERDKDLTNLHVIKGWAELLNKIEAKIKDFEKDFDKPLKKQLEEIYIRDQTLRVLIPTVKKKFYSDSEQVKYIRRLVSEQDSLNLLEVIEIIDKRGWVGKSLVGDKANQGLWFVIQHAELELQEKYLPLLKESVLLRESNAKDMALLEDRINVRNGRPQVYGTQMKYNQETEKWEFPEITDPEYVNQRRRGVGLYPIEDDVNRLNIDWSIKQKEK